MSVLPGGIDTVGAFTVAGAAIGAWFLTAPHGAPAVARRRVTALARSGARSQLGGPTTRSASEPRGPAVRSGPGLRAVAAGAAAAVVLLLLDPPGPLVVGPATAGVAWLLLGRLEPAAVRRARVSVEQDLPFAADLLATCLTVGTPLPQSLQVTGAAVGGVLGEAFVRAATACALGASLQDAVAPWATDRTLAPLAPIARVLVRASTSGSALAASSAQLAHDLRAARRWRVDEAARRAGVRAAAPLGICFLPAFVLLGIVPVVLAGARTLAF